MKTRKTEQPGKSRSAEEWIYGVNPVREAMRSGRSVRAVYISESRRQGLADLEREIDGRGIVRKKVDNLFLDSRFPKGHQGIAAVVAVRKPADLEELLQIPARRGETPFFMILDCIEDPRNFGAILRVADAGGVHGVVIQAHRSASLGPEAVKASAGAAEYVPVAVVSNIKHAMREMKEAGVTVIGAEAGSGKAPWEVDLKAPLALVIGSEGRGLRRTVSGECDLQVSIPMSGAVNSLNASVAAGILVFEINRQRVRKKGLY